MIDFFDILSGKTVRLWNYEGDLELYAKKMKKKNDKTPALRETLSS